MTNPAIHAITREDVHATIDRIFDGLPWLDDANQMRAIAHLAEGLLRNKERHYPDQDRRLVPATLGAGVPSSAQP